MASKRLILSERQPYVTKRIVVRAATKAVKEAYARSMDLIGYSIEAQDGWLIKKFPDGQIQQLKELPTVNRPTKLVLR